MTFSTKLDKRFYLRDTELVAHDLIGKILVRRIGNEILSAKIVETEAYLSENDLASHSANGISKRNSAMFDEGGRLYVYLIYGIHYCINVVTEEKGRGSAVLLRAAEPIEGIQIFRKNRSTNDIFNLCSGPGKLAQAFGFDLSNNNMSLMSNDLYLFSDGLSEEFKVNQSERIGIKKSKDLLLRFTLANSNYLSRKS